MTAKNKRPQSPPGKGPAVQAEPSFYREQLTAALKVHPDIIRALLEEGQALHYVRGRRSYQPIHDQKGVILCLLEAAHLHSRTRCSPAYT